MAEAKKANYVWIDIIKFICAIFIVGIHTVLLDNQNDTIQWYIMHVLFRFAVPFFFVCSGFLFGKKHLENPADLKKISTKQIKRLLIPFIFWMLVSLPYEIITVKGSSTFIIAIKIIKNVIFYPWGALWFLLAVIVAIIIEYFFLKKNKLNWAMILSAFLFIFGLLGNSYYFAIKGTVFQKVMDMYTNTFITTRNGIFVGFPLFTLGVCIAQKEEWIKTIAKPKLYILLGIVLILQIGEVTFIRNKAYADDHSLFITTIAMVAIVLTLCIKYQYVIFQKLNTKLLRNMSTGIYFMHSPVNRYLMLLQIPNISNVERFSIVLAITIVIWLILYKINCKYINYIIK